METASLLREYDTVIGTVTVPEGDCSGLLQEFDELMGNGDKTTSVTQLDTSWIHTW